MLANGGSHRKIPLARIMLLQCFICEYTGGADLSEVAAEFTFQHSIFCPPEINIILRGKCIKVFSACIILVKANAFITLNASVHFMINERPEILVFIGALFVSEFTIGMASHYGHILQM